MAAVVTDPVAITAGAAGVAVAGGAADATGTDGAACRGTVSVLTANGVVTRDCNPRKGVVCEACRAPLNAAQDASRVALNGVVHCIRDLIPVLQSVFDQVPGTDARRMSDAIVMAILNGTSIADVDILSLVRSPMESEASIQCKAALAAFAEPFRAAIEAADVESRVFDDLFKLTIWKGPNFVQRMENELSTLFKGLHLLASSFDLIKQDVEDLVVAMYSLLSSKGSPATTGRASKRGDLFTKLAKWLLGSKTATLTTSGAVSASGGAAAGASGDAVSDASGDGAPGASSDAASGASGDAAADALRDPAAAWVNARYGLECIVRNGIIGHPDPNTRKFCADLASRLGIPVESAAILGTTGLGLGAQIPLNWNSGSGQWTWAETLQFVTVDFYDIVRVADRSDSKLEQLHTLLVRFAKHTEQLASAMDKTIGASDQIWRTLQDSKLGGHYPDFFKALSDLADAVQTAFCSDGLAKFAEEMYHVRQHIILMCAFGHHWKVLPSNDVSRVVHLIQHLHRIVHFAATLKRFAVHGSGCRDFDIAAAFDLLSSLTSRYLHDEEYLRQE